MFRAQVLIVRKSKLYYTASGIITPIGGLPVHGTATYKYITYIERHGQQNIKIYFYMLQINRKSFNIFIYSKNMSLENKSDRNI